MPAFTNYIQQHYDQNFQHLCQTTWSVLQLINIQWCSMNSQHSNLSNPYYKYLSIDNYKQDILPTFMLSLCVFFTGSLNSQHSIFDSHKEKTVLGKKRCQGISPRNMLASWVNIYSLATEVYLDNKVVMICQLFL